MAYELEATLQARGKTKEYQALMADLPAAGATSFTRQQAPLGLGHAVWCAREIVGDEPFAVLLPDMITMAGKRGTPLPRPMHRDLRGSTAATSSRSRRCRWRRPTNTASCRSATTRATPSRSPAWSRSPPRERRPRPRSSRAATSSTRPSSSALEKGEKGAGGEIQLTDAMIKLAKEQPFHGVRFDGKTYDTGSKLGFLAANVAFALARPELAEGFRAELKKILGS